MPSLRRLLEVLYQLEVDPGEIQLPNRIYQALVIQAQNLIGEEDDEQDQED